jgi:hypothetical protein
MFQTTNHSLHPNVGICFVIFFGIFWAAMVNLPWLPSCRSLEAPRAAPCWHPTSGSAQPSWPTAAEPGPVDLGVRGLKRLGKAGYGKGWEVLLELANKNTFKLKNMIVNLYLAYKHLKTTNKPMIVNLLNHSLVN